MPSPIPSDRYLIISGAMKCGTSSLFDFLAAHPQVCSSRVKEPEYFTRRQVHGLRRKPFRYAELWSFDPSIHLYALEASTGYTKYPYEANVPRRMAEAGIQPRFIYLVRDPVRRMESHLNFITNATGFAPATSPFAEHLLDPSRYHLQLTQYLEYFERDRMLVLSVDDLSVEPERFIQRICAFLELDRSEFPVGFPFVYDSRRQSRVERWLRQHWMGFLIKRLPARLRLWVQDQLAARFPAPKFRYSEAQRATIRELLRDDVCRLGREFDVDISRWGF